MGNHVQRRGLFALVGSSALLPNMTSTVPSSGSPDFSLLAICARAEEADRLMLAANRRHKSLTDSTALRDAARHESDKWFGQFVDLCQEATKISAQTPDGLRAKARLAYLDRQETTESSDFTMVVLRDIGWGVEA